MPVEIRELTPARRSNARNAERLYLIFGAADDIDARALMIAEPTIPTTVGGMPRDLLQWEINESEEDHYIGTAVWASPEWQTPTQQPLPTVGEFSVSFDISGQSTKITQSRQTISRTYRPGTFNKPDFKGAINVIGTDPQDMTVEGTDILVPFITYNYNTVRAAATVTDAWVASTSAIVGHVNNSTYKGFPSGELLLTRVSGTPRVDTDGADVFDLQFGFAILKNETNIIVAEYGPPGNQVLQVPTKRGWDYLWIYFAVEMQDMDNGAEVVCQRPVKVAHAAFVEQVYDYTSYAPLGL